VELDDLLGHDHATSPPEDLDISSTLLTEPVDEVAEILDVATLIRADGHRVGVFFDHGGNNVVHRAVVAQVDDLRSLALQQAPDDVDRGVVAVEEAGRSDEANRLRRAIQLHVHGRKLLQRPTILEETGGIFPDRMSRKPWGPGVGAQWPRRNHSSR